MKIEQVTTTYKTLTLTENELRETAIGYIRNAISYTESENYKLAFFCYGKAQAINELFHHLYGLYLQEESENDGDYADYKIKLLEMFKNIK